MLEKFNQWYNKYYTEFTWFLIGFMLADALFCFGQGRWGAGLLSLIIAYANYWFGYRDK